jgi:transposase
MEAIAVTVGIDVSKDRLDVHVRGREEGSGEERCDVPRDTEGNATLAERLRALAPGAIGLEATGGLEAVVVASLAEAGLPVVVVNSAQVRAFANALGKRAKMDAIDPAVIAHFVEATDRRSGPFRTPKPVSSRISWPAGARSWR